MEANVSKIEKMLLDNRQYQGRQRFERNLTIDKFDQEYIEEVESAHAESDETIVE